MYKGESRLRKECLLLRRRSLTDRRRATEQTEKAESKAAKKELEDTICKSKLRCWKILCDAVNKDTWGKVYQIVSGRLENRSPVGHKDPETMEKIVHALFSTHAERENKERISEEAPSFTVEELSVLNYLIRAKAC